MNRRRRGALATLLALAACRGEAAAPPLVVFAAASLAAPFQALGDAFRAEHPQCAVQFAFEGSPHLLFKLQQGSRADVLATADLVDMERASAEGLTADAPATFAGNRLAILVTPGNPHRITELGDLARPGLRVALCAPTVPAGRYARQALASAGVRVRSLSDESSVTALAGKVRLRELDAAIAYATDARGEVEAVAVAPEHDVGVRYPIAALRVGRASHAGAQFVAFVLSDAGRRILVDHGFAVP